MEIGLGISPAAIPNGDPVGEARMAEDLGFDFVSTNDHLHGPSPTLEPWTTLSWVGAATSRIKMATRVMGVPYRNPAVVAKMAETFDRLSAGRLILGLGAGAVDEEFRAFGLGDLSARDKVDGLEEAIHILRGLWSAGSFTFAGRFHRTMEAQLEPKPGHSIPIWLGTYGPRMLALTGRLADGWIPSLGYAPPEQIPSMREQVIKAATDAGRRPEDLTCVYNVEIRVEDRGTPEVELSGPAGALVERLVGLTELGFSGFNLIPAGPDRLQQVDRLGREVLPALRTALD